MSEGFSTIVQIGPVWGDNFRCLAESTEERTRDSLRVSALSRLTGKVKPLINRLGQSVIVNAWELEQGGEKELVRAFYCAHVYMCVNTAVLITKILKRMCAEMYYCVRACSNTFSGNFDVGVTHAGHGIRRPTSNDVRHRVRHV